MQSLPATNICSSAIIPVLNGPEVSVVPAMPLRFEMETVRAHVAVGSLRSTPCFYP